MPTANRREFVTSAIRMFLGQGYEEKELIIVDDGSDKVDDLVPPHPQIRYIREEPQRLSLGEKRNLACQLARGEIILHWDDDDWYAPWRVAYQVNAMTNNGFELCGLNRAFFVDAAACQAWELHRPQLLYGATLGFRRSFWEKHRFANVRIGEDNRFVATARGARIGALENSRFFVCRVHARNTCPKHARGWPSRPFHLVQSVIGDGWEKHFGGNCGLPAAEHTENVGTALISAASGIGDILRVTPLIRAAYRLGYDVDVLLAPDDPAAAELVRGRQKCGA